MHKEWEMTEPRIRGGRSRRSVAVALIVSLLATLFAASVSPSAAAAKRPPKAPKVDFWLTILHNNDGESQLVDLGEGFLEDFGGAARFKTVVDDLKKDAVTGRPWSPGAKRGVMMVSSGDNFLAGPEFNAGLERGIPFYDTVALDLIGYDAIALGNHDFDFGPEVLADFLSGFSLTQPPYLSSNLDFTAEPVLQAYVDNGRIAKSVVIRERGERIGVIGATTPALPSISSPRDVVVNAVAPAVQAEVGKLQKQRVNKIVLISHLQTISEDVALAAELTGIDVVIAGGGDELLANDDDLLIPALEENEAGEDVLVRPEPFATYPLIASDASGLDIPIVTTSGNYGYVGNLVVGFDKAGKVIVVDEDRSRPGTSRDRRLRWHAAL
jgi:2',3'-cyclic-nucleotide 2'-phosphodiesterase (5'-nucleotidase family)